MLNNVLFSDLRPSHPPQSTWAAEAGNSVQQPWQASKPPAPLHLPWLSVFKADKKKERRQARRQLFCCFFSTQPLTEAHISVCHVNKSPSAAHGADGNSDSLYPRHREPLPALQSFTADRILCYLYPDTATFTNHLICRRRQTKAASCSLHAPGLLCIKDSSVDGPSLIESGFVAAGRGSSASLLLCSSNTPLHLASSPTFSGVALCLLTQPSVPYPYCACVSARACWDPCC